MSSLFRLISLPYFRRHWLRTALTVGGIVIGVAVYAAMRVANGSLQNSFQETVNRLAGKAALQVTSGQAGFPEPVLEEVLAVEGVAAAAPVVEIVAQPIGLAEGSLMILGVDLTGDRSVREYDLEGQEDALEDPLVFLAQPDSICLNREFAERNGLKMNGTLSLATPVGRREFTVRGLLEPRGTANAFGGSLAVMDIYAAQFVFNRGQKFDRIDVVVDAAEPPAVVQQRLAERLGPAYAVESPGRRGQRIQSLTRGFSDGLTWTSFLALVVGVFLIFNTFAVAVIQRRRDIGILRALGATRRQIQGMIFLESLVLGLVGSAAGIFLGWTGSKALVGLMDRVVATTYGVAANSRDLPLDIALVTTALVLGLGAALAGALFPARSAAQVDPAVALQKGRYQVMLLGENRRRTQVGLALLALGLALFALPVESAARQYASLLVTILGLSLFVPMASHAAARLVRFPLGRLFGMEGLLASDSLIQAPRRTSATVAALIFSLSFVIASAVFTRSLKDSLVEWMEQVINPDLVINSSPSLAEHPYRFDPELADALKAIPGIRQVDSLRVARETFRGETIMILSIEMDQYYDRADPVVVEGDEREMRRRMAAEEALVISDNFAALYDVHAEDHLELKTPSGPVSFPVVGVVRDFSSDKGSLVLDRACYVKYWKDTGVDVFDVMVDSGRDPDQVRRDILETLGDRAQMFILTQREFHRDLMRLIDQFFLLSYVQILVAILVAVMGIINTLFVSITDRMREIGVFRAIGGTAAQVGKMVLLEAGTIALIASMYGILGGAYLGYFLNTTFSMDLFGWYIPYVFPWEIAAALAPFMVAIGLAAAWFPSTLATRTRLAEALAYE